MTFVFSVCLFNIHHLLLGGYWVDFWMNEWIERVFSLWTVIIIIIIRPMMIMTNLVFFVVFLGSYDHQIFVLLLDVNILFKSINMIDWLIDFGSSVGNLFRHAPNTHLYLKCDLNNNANQAIDLLIIIFTYVFFVCCLYFINPNVFFLFCFKKERLKKNLIIETIIHINNKNYLRKLQ